ncbi:PaaI family thioesterase [Legionella sp. W05-934-2]|jgi:uncharacterized protein (TIGR00369 family)|uniref:PaaI family thioesterase n=1 Tax=Legionella sp. W05-934-2 TaxID=1198649 RepID=UPI003463331B
MNFFEFLKELKGVSPPLNDKYGEWLGYRIEKYDINAGYAKTKLIIREAHLSPSMAVHGGVISGFLDFSCGCAVFTQLQREALCSTVDLGVKYFKPVKLGDVIYAEARVVHKGKSLSSVVAELYQANDENTLYALATGTFNIYIPKQRV